MSFGNIVGKGEKYLLQAFYFVSQFLQPFPKQINFLITLVINLHMSFESV